MDIFFQRLSRIFFIELTLSAAITELGRNFQWTAIIFVKQCLQKVVLSLGLKILNKWIRIGVTNKGKERSAFMS